MFSFAQGIIHPYYTVALAPAIGAVIGIGAMMLWRRRDELAPMIVLAAAVIITAVWQFRLLDRTPSWLPWLRYSILMVGVATALLLLMASRMVRRVGTVVAAGGAGGQPGRTGRVRRLHRPHSAHRIHPERRTVRAGHWLRRTWRRRPGRLRRRYAPAASAPHRPVEPDAGRHRLPSAAAPALAVASGAVEPVAC